MKRLLEVTFGVNLVLALFQQWMIPSVTNSVDPFSEMDPIKITERLLKLSVSNLCIEVIPKNALIRIISLFSLAYFRQISISKVTTMI